MANIKSGPVVRKVRLTEAYLVECHACGEVVETTTDQCPRPRCGAKLRLDWQGEHRRAAA